MNNINNELIKLEVVGNEIQSIKYKDAEILNTTRVWKKKFPVLFPAIGLKKTHIVNGKKYPIRKHGFWKELDLNKSKCGNQIVMRGFSQEKEYPFKINVFQSILLKENLIKISTKFSGEKVPYQFGYHPAFNYDLGKINFKGKAWAIKHDFSTEIVNLNIGKISELNWKNVDTFIIEEKEIIIENDNYILKITTNLPYIGIWTNRDSYICIEPWSNLPALVKEDNSIIDDKKLKMQIEIIEREK